jgi:hypothetical protein
MSEIERKILRRMEVYYKSRQKAEEWFKRPNRYFLGYLRKVSSPEEMVELGKGEEVWDWIVKNIGEA